MSAHYYSSRLHSEFIMVAGWSTSAKSVQKKKKQQNGDLTINLNPCGPQANHNFEQFLLPIRWIKWLTAHCGSARSKATTKLPKRNVTQHSDNEKWSSRFQLRTCSMHTARLGDANAFHHLHIHWNKNSHTLGRFASITRQRDSRCFRLSCPLNRLANGDGDRPKIKSDFILC